MHLVLANRWYPSEGAGGGVSAYNSILAHALCDLGHRVTVVTQSRDGVCRGYLDGAVQVHALAVPLAPRALRAIRAWRRWERTICMLHYAHKLSRYLRRLHHSVPFDLVEFAEINAEGGSFLRGSPRPVPAVIRCHTPTMLLNRYYPADFHTYEWRCLADRERRAVLRADAVTAPSSDMAREIAQWTGCGAHRITVIPNPIHLPPVSSRWPSEPVDVLVVGRFERAKGTQLLADVIPAVLAQTAARFTLVGADRPYSGVSMQAWLRRRLEAAGSAHAVAIYDYVDSQTLDTLYRQAAVALVPSVAYESFSYTVADAMAYGLAVVASATGGIPETLADCGRLVQVGDVQGFVTALVDLIDQPAVRTSLGARARSRAAARFAPEIVAGATLDAYEQALARWQGAHSA